MSATVTYKGNTLTTVNNETKVLETAGTWLEDDITITDSSSAIIVDTPDSHGGTVRQIITGATTTLQAQKTVTLTPTNTTVTVTPDAGYTAMTSVVATSPSTLYQYFHGTINADYVDDDLITVPSYVCFRYSGGIKGCRFPNATLISDQAFYLAGLTGTFFAPKAKLGRECLYGTKITTCISGAGTSSISQLRPLGKYETAGLTTVDLTFSTSAGLSGEMFSGQSNFVTLILREEVIYPMYGVSAFGGTPFASGGSGGTIYIPKALYDHLGDGTALDYKAATNWSTIDGYGTITWVQIEGSQYDGYYADGTAIPAS